MFIVYLVQMYINVVTGEEEDISNPQCHYIKLKIEFTLVSIH